MSEMNTPETAVPYVKDQIYGQLQAKLVESGSLFEDEVFPAIDSSAYFQEAPPHGITWLRPSVSKHFFLRTSKIKRSLGLP